MDSDGIWLDTLRRWLTAYGVPSIATADSVASANSALTGDEELVITEVIVARESCLGLIARAADRGAAPAIIAMSDRAPRAQVFRLKDFGVHAYLEKPFSGSMLYRCLEQLAKGSAFGRAASEPRAEEREPDRVLGSAVEELVSAHRKRYQLTNAEAEVLRCILRGVRRADVARERSISVNTLKTQVRSLLSKSGASNLRELVGRASCELRGRA